MTSTWNISTRQQRNKRGSLKSAASVPVDAGPRSPMQCLVISRREAQIIAMYAAASHDYIWVSFLTLYRLAGWAQRFS
jgi:hypothetical protein